MDAKLPVQVPFVAVIWEDATGDDNGEYTLEKAQEDHHAAHFLSLGFKAVDDEKGITLFAEQRLGDEVGMRGRSFIPRGMIKEVIEGKELVRLLGLSRPRKKKPNPEPDMTKGS